MVLSVPPHCCCGSWVLSAAFPGERGLVDDRVLSYVDLPRIALLNGGTCRTLHLGTFYNSGRPARVQRGLRATIGMRVCGGCCGGGDAGVIAIRPPAVTIPVLCHATALRWTCLPSFCSYWQFDDYGVAFCADGTGPVALVLNRLTFLLGAFVAFTPELRGGLWRLAGLLWAVAGDIFLL
jgi:hypothetical protein